MWRYGSRTKQKLQTKEEYFKEKEEKLQSEKMEAAATNITRIQKRSPAVAV